MMDLRIRSGADGVVVGFVFVEHECFIERNVVPIFHIPVPMGFKDVLRVYLPIYCVHGRKNALFQLETPLNGCLEILAVQTPIK